MALPSAPFDTANSIFAGLSVVKLQLDPQITGITAATDTLTKTAHGLAVDQAFTYVSGTGFTGLTAGVTYYVVAVPSADTFQVSGTIGGAAITVGTSTAGVIAPVVIFEAAQLDDDPQQEMKYIDRPDSTGVLRHARGVRTKSFENFTFGLDEVKRLLEIFAGSMSGRRTGYCTLWIPDPDDATGKVSLKSEADFACTITRDGKITHGNSDFSKVTIKIESNKIGEVTWTRDGDA